MQNLIRTRSGRHQVRSARAALIGGVLLALLLTSSCLLSISAPTVHALAIGLGSGASGAAPSQSGSRTSLPKVLPKSPAPGTVYEVNLGTDPALDFPLAALEGIVARTQPRIFLIQGSQDNFWFSYTAQNYGLSYQYVKASAKASILQLFKSYVTNPQGKVKLVLYDSNDPIYPTQLEMAITLAGVKTALPVSTRELPTIEGIFGADNVTIVQNLTGRFTDKVSAYTWLWNTVQNSVTKRFVGLAPSGVLGLTDYLVENKAFVFEFSVENDVTSQEYALASTILSAYPQLTPVLGYFGLGGEGPTISFLSPRELLMVTSDSVTNLSLYSGLPDATDLSQTPSGQKLVYNPSKTYIMFSYTQGNSLGYLFYGYKSQWDMQDSNGQYYRAEIPEAWQINPLAAELAPPMMQYYYSTMTANDSFYTGPSGGAGYVYPEMLPNLGSYLSLAKPFDANANLNQYFIITQSKKWNPTLYQQYATDLSPTAIFIKGPTGQPQMVSGVPVMSMTLKSITTSNFTSQDVTNTTSEIRSASGTYKFIFFFLGATNPGMPFIKAVIQQLGSGFVPVTSDQFASLYQQSQGQDPAGNSSSTPALPSGQGSRQAALGISPLVASVPLGSVSPMTVEACFFPDSLN